MGGLIFAVSRSYFIAVHTASYHSYSVEASNPLTSFIDFCFKDRFLRKKVWRNSHFRFTKLISHIRFTFLCELRLFLAVSDYAVAAML